MPILVSTPGQPEKNAKETKPSFDSELLKVARHIYKNYCVLNPKLTKKPLGVAINPKTHRGQLVFSSTPILLPEECFVPLKQIENEIA
jgi:hypothetical protein